MDGGSFAYALNGPALVFAGYELIPVPLAVDNVQDASCRC